MSRNKLYIIQQQIASALENMQAINCMLKGSYGITYRRCGKPNCWCADPQAQGHPSYRVTWNDDGISYTRNIPVNDRVWAKQAVENYKWFKSERRSIRSLCQKLQVDVDNLGINIIKKTRAKKTYFKKNGKLLGDANEQNR